MISVERHCAVNTSVPQRHRCPEFQPTVCHGYQPFVVERFGRLDCVVNNAGAGGKWGPIAETSVEGFNQSIALLLGGTFLGIKFALPLMQGGGTE